MRLQEAVQRVREASDQKNAVRRAYDILTSRYRGDRAKTYALFWRLFENDVERLWSRTGFLHCTKLNRLLRYLLVESGWVETDDIELRWTLTWFISPHQYVQIRKSDGVLLRLDVWAANYGTPYGDYAHGFH